MPIRLSQVTPTGIGCGLGRRALLPSGARRGRVEVDPCVGGALGHAVERIVLGPCTGMDDQAECALEGGPAPEAPVEAKSELVEIGR